MAGDLGFGGVGAGGAYGEPVLAAPAIVPHGEKAQPKKQAQVSSPSGGQSLTQESLWEDRFQTIQKRLSDIERKLDALNVSRIEEHKKSESAPGSKFAPSINTAPGRTINAETRSDSRQDFIAASIRGWGDYARRAEATKKALPTAESPKLTKAD